MKKKFDQMVIQRNTLPWIHQELARVTINFTFVVYVAII